jgi:hypothetical protein
MLHLKSVPEKMVDCWRTPMGFGVLSGKFLSDSHPKQDLVLFLNTRDTVASAPQLQQNYTKK